jgi:hypothetical protein
MQKFSLTNLTSLNGKCIEEPKNIKSMPQHNKGYSQNYTKWEKTENIFSKPGMRQG